MIKTEMDRSLHTVLTHEIGPSGEITLIKERSLMGVGPLLWVSWIVFCAALAMVFLASGRDDPAALMLIPLLFGMIVGGFINMDNVGVVTYDDAIIDVVAKQGRLVRNVTLPRVDACWCSKGVYYKLITDGKARLLSSSLTEPTLQGLLAMRKDSTKELQDSIHAMSSEPSKNTLASKLEDMAIAAVDAAAARQETSEAIDEIRKDISRRRSSAKN